MTVIAAHGLWWKEGQQQQQQLYQLWNDDGEFLLIEVRLRQNALRDITAHGYASSVGQQQQL